MIGFRYVLSRASATLSTTNDSLTILAATNRPLLLVRVEFGGMGAATAANDIGLFVSTGGTTGGGAVTPKKWNSAAPTQAFTNFTTWSAQPTLSGDPLKHFSVNANGGIDKFVATRLDDAIPVPAATQVSIRSLSGTSVVNLEVHIVEI